MESQTEEEKKQIEELKKMIKGAEKQLRILKYTVAGLIVLGIGVMVRPYSQGTFWSLFVSAIGFAIAAGVLLWRNG